MDDTCWVCPTCAYELREHGPGGICPECGRAFYFDASSAWMRTAMVLIFGMAAPFLAYLGAVRLLD